MRTLKKFNLSELERELDVVSEQVQRETIGGTWPGLNSGIEYQLVAHWTEGTGNNYDVSDQLGSIAAAAESCSYTSRWSIIDGNQYEVRDVNFYGNESYDFAFGTASLYYDQCGNCVGFADNYDFNTGDNTRSGWASFATTAGSLFGSFAGAKEFTINAGIHE